jgi:aspartyl-tRNA(Asn)/glutamyl-tRNA(Gln) amidotransferase subunit C
MAITREDVLHVAKLASLDLTEDEIARLEVQLNDILEAVGKVSELDLSDVPPTSHPLDVVNVFRPDVPGPSLPLDDAFANAPERDGDHFRVPPTGVAEESSA